MIANTERAQTKSFMAVLLALLLFTACAPQQPAEEEAAEPAPPPAPTAATSWEKDGLKVTAMDDSPKFPGATLTLPGLEDGSNLEAGTHEFAFEVLGYELGAQTSDAEGKGLANSAKGQHIHLILDNGPYSAHYEPMVETELSDGVHVLLAFLSRSYHESLKNPEAVVLRQFTVGEVGDDAEMADLTAPHLFYSRPKGTYVGADTEKLMLDFYLWNTELAPDGNKVRATVNGTEFTFSKWVPYVIEGLPVGETTIQLELIDAEGNVIPGPFNTVTRTVTLEAAPEGEGGEG